MYWPSRVMNGVKKVTPHNSWRNSKLSFLDRLSFRVTTSTKYVDFSLLDVSKGLLLVCVEQCFPLVQFSLTHFPPVDSEFSLVSTRKEKKKIFLKLFRRIKSLEASWRTSTTVGHFQKNHEHSVSVRQQKANLQNVSHTKVNAWTRLTVRAYSLFRP
jgi:hypothetical protein